MTAPDIAIALCTLDRGPAIDVTVRSLLDQDLPAERYELLLIDNDSSPENAAILRDLAAQHAPTVRYIHEPMRGLCHARNRAIAETQAPVVVYIDDDAKVGRGWLTAYVEAFAADPPAGVLGGAVELQHDAERPEWFEEWMLGYLGHYDHGDRPCRLPVLEAPRGCNMAFRREALEKVGGFTPVFQRAPGSLMSLDEQDVCQRIVRQGYEIGYIPGAGIIHFVEALRWTDGWFQRRLHDQGVSLATFDAMHFGRGRVLVHVLGKLRRLLYRRGMKRRELWGYVKAGMRLLFTAPPTAGHAGNIGG